MGHRAWRARLMEASSASLSYPQVRSATRASSQPSVPPHLTIRGEDRLRSVLFPSACIRLTGELQRVTLKLSRRNIGTNEVKVKIEWQINTVTQGRWRLLGIGLQFSIYGRVPHRLVEADAKIARVSRATNKITITARKSDA